METAHDGLYGVLLWEEGIIRGKDRYAPAVRVTSTQQTASPASHHLTADSLEPLPHFMAADWRSVIASWFHL